MQACSVLIFTIGLRTTFRTLWCYPAIVLTPMFGNWTFGPVKKDSQFNVLNCTGSSSFIYVSYFHTWITYFISVIGTLITFFLWIELSHPDDWTWEKFNGRINNVTKEGDLFTPETWEESPG